MDLAVLRGYSDIFQERISLEALKEQLRQFNRRHVVYSLAQMNLLLSLYITNPENFPGFEEFLISSFLDNATRNHPNFIKLRKEKNTSFFSRHQILPLLRLSALESSEDGTVIPDGQTPGGYLLGRCCLIMTDHLVGEGSEVLRIPISQMNAEQRKKIDLQIAPLFELQWPPELVKAVVRWDTMLSEILHSDRFKEIAKEFDLARRFNQLTNLTIEQYRDFSLSILIWYLGLKLEDLDKNPNVLKFHRDRIISNMVIDKEDFESFLKIDSITSAALQNQLTEFSKMQSNILYYWDLAVFRRWPLLNLDDIVFICIDPFFLLEKLSESIHHTIRDVLPSDEDKQRWSSGYGYLFQFYVDSLMQEIYSKEPENFISFPHFVKKAKNEAFDGIVVVPDGHLILLEYKGGFLKQESKYSGDLAKLEDDLNKRFGIGERGAVRQLASNIERLFHSNRNQRSQIPELMNAQMEIPKVTEITPVIIVQEQFLRFGFTWLLKGMFEELIAQSNVSAAISINPLQVLDIQTLETMRPNLIAGDFRLEQVLKNRGSFDKDQINPWEIHLNAAFPDYRTREDEKLQKGFDSVFKRLSKSFFGVDRDYEEKGSSQN